MLEQESQINLAAENERLRLRVNELESLVRAISKSNGTNESTLIDRIDNLLKRKLEMLIETQLYGRSGYVLISQSKELLECSANVSSLLGFRNKKDRITYEDYLNSIFEDDRLHVEKSNNNQMTTGHEIVSLKFRIQHGGQRFIHISQHSRLFHDSYSTERYLFIILQNITERSRIESQLKFSEKKYHSIFTSTPLGILIYNLDYHGNLILTDMNPTARVMLRIKNDSIIGLPIEKAFPPLANTEIPKNYKMVARDGITWQGNDIFYEYGAIKGFYDVMAFQSAQGSATIVFQDITERKQVENLLKESEEKYRKLVDRSIAGVFKLTLRGKILFANNALVRMLEYSSLSDFLSRSVTDFLKTGENLKKLINLLKKQNGVSNYRMEAITKTGKTIHVSVNTQLDNDEISGVLIDITEKVKAEQELVNLNKELREINDQVNVINAALRTSNERYFDLFNNTGTANCIVDQNALITLCNSRFEEISGYTLSEIQNQKKITDFIENSNFIDCVDIKNRIEANPECEFDFLDMSGFSRRIQIQAGKIRSTNEIIVSIIDISDRKEAEEEIMAYSKKLADQNEILRIINEELVKAKEKAEESDKLKSSFLANMSHEIRTPMNAILGFANLLKNKNFADDRKIMFIDIINSKSRQLLQIITDIIDISKIEAGQISIFNKNFKINSLLNDLYLSFENMRKEEDKPVKFKIIAGLSDNEDAIFSDKIRVEQILTNFLSNAYKFTDSGSIEIGYKVENESLVFYVKDTGIGMTPEEQQVIFDRFRQVDSSNSRPYGGTGLGLAISKGLAERMKGRIYLESHPGKGSVFYLQLPYYKGQTVTPVEKVFDESAFDWSNKTILIAEDESDNFTFFESILKATRATVIWAKNGLEAVDLCRNNKAIDLVLMDVKMPHMNGLEATRQIKKIRNTLPIIIQTAYAMSADEENCMTAGCDAYISKPIKVENLFQMIKEYI